jgi:hypothetical protein
VRDIAVKIVEVILKEAIEVDTGKQAFNGKKWKKLVILVGPHRWTFKRKSNVVDIVEKILKEKCQPQDMKEEGI